MTIRFWSSRALLLAGVQSLFVGAYAALLFAFSRPALRTDPMLDAGSFLVLGLLTAVRLNRSYERWWEARTLWGSLVNSSRNLAVKIRVFADPDAEVATRIHRAISAFAFALRDQLRDTVPSDNSLSDTMREVYAPIKAWAREGRISGDEARMFDLEARGFLEVAGACERIKNTPLPLALTWVTRVALGAFLLMLPWLLQEELGWLVVPATVMVAFSFLVVETLATALENPFGTELNQLNLTDISFAIEASTGETLGVS